MNSHEEAMDEDHAAPAQPPDANTSYRPGTLVPTDRKDENHLIQINASSIEIGRRISALIEQKQRENDNNNCQEFCGVHPSIEDPEDSCARTSAVFVPRAGGKSHIKVTRVVNMYGPQTRLLGNAGLMADTRNIRQEASGMQGMEERLLNMEEHLKVKDDRKKDVYSRLKNLEERILFLEGLSPEYFTSGAPQPKRRKHQAPKVTQDLSVQDIDNRMQDLRDSLLKRKAHPQPS